MLYCTPITNLPRKKLETIPITILKYLAINSTKEMKGFYNGKKLKKTLEYKKVSHGAVGSLSVYALLLLINE